MNPAQEPGFWCEYQPPKSHVAALVQMPIDQIDGEKLIVAYMRDERAKKGKK